MCGDVRDPGQNDRRTTHVGTSGTITEVHSVGGRPLNAVRQGIANPHMSVAESRLEMCSGFYPRTRRKAPHLFAGTGGLSAIRCHRLYGDWRPSSSRAGPGAIWSCTFRWPLYTPLKVYIHQSNQGSDIWGRSAGAAPDSANYSSRTALAHSHARNVCPSIRNSMPTAEGVERTIRAATNMG